MDSLRCEFPNNRVVVSPSLKKMEEYESGPQKIAEAVRGLSRVQMSYKIHSREWNINQIIVHLADTELFFCERMRKIIVEEKPLLQSFDQDEWANRLFYEKQNYHFALELLHAQRRSTAVLLRLMPPDFWKREGIRDEKIVSLYDIFLTALHHIPTHMQQIQDIKNAPQFPTR